ncbi:MAG: MFS transporter, partial [Theionarchaea archaeon]|nr:MFS transporter [Theionarchaea archaeon]
FLGCLFWSAALITIGGGTTFPLFLVGFIFWGIGDAFFSGAYPALLYDTVKKAKKEEYLRVKGRLLFISSLSLICGSISGGYIYEVDKQLPWIGFGILYGVAALIVSTMKEPYPSGRDYTWRNQVTHLKNSFTFSFTHREVRFLIVFSVLILMPVSILTNLAEQPYLISLGFSITSLGFIFAVTRGFIGLVSNFIYKIERKLKEKLSFFLVTGVYSVIFVLLGLFNIPVMVVLVMILYFSRDYKNALIETYINNHIESHQRATVLSIQSFSLNMAYTVYIFTGGVLLDMFSMNTVFMMLGVTTFVMTMPYLILKYR